MEHKQPVSLKMLETLTKLGIPAAAFLLGLAAKHCFDRWGKRSDRLHAKREQEAKYKREAYLPFLKEIESILLSEEPLNEDRIKSAREKFTNIQIDGSEHIILTSNIILQQLEWKAEGIVTSHDHLTPEYKKCLLELVRSELHGREPDLKAFQEELNKDPLHALLSGIPREPKPPGSIEMIFDFDARNAKSKTDNNPNNNKMS